MKSIRSRLIGGLLLGLTALLTASGTLLYLYVKSALTRQFDAALLAEAQAICSFIKLQADGDVEVDVPQSPTPQLGATVQSQYFQVWGENGRVLMRSPSLGEFNLPLVATADEPIAHDIELPQARPSKCLVVRFVPPAEDEDAAESGKPATPQSAAVSKTVTVAVAQDRSELKRTLAVLLSAQLTFGATLVLAAAAVVNVVVRQGLAPLRKVAHEAAQIDPQSLDFRFSQEALATELQPICLRLNESLDRLQKAFERQRRFTADAAHELRTPIAELRALADVALKWDGDQDTSLGYFKDAQEIAQQMEGLVNSLLALARCESIAASVMESIDLGELIRTVWSRHQTMAAARRLTVTFDLPEQLAIRTDRTMVQSMLDNLLGNAAEYTRLGGSVVCALETSRSGVQFSITNDIDNLSPDDVLHLREAFWRKDSARTSGLHCGLGLTLTDAYAKALGGSLPIRVLAPDSLCVTLFLPPLV